MYQLFPKQALVFTCLQYKSFENIVGKGEIARCQQFLLFPQCFLSIWRTFCHFHPILNCCLQTLPIWKSLKFLVLEMVHYVSCLSFSDSLLLCDLGLTNTSWALHYHANSLKTEPSVFLHHH